ncbi:MBL fold metallo-hydrolase [Bacillus luteolus]|uniref:MBL fold metallo-hydrolase n=1 Tax=Litchfieldia luteola TaxID=682179 RepID=A0ABR9QPG3_9BACI|nr:MBL fold metallo-hydrolase [Cytobacillus luteolus]MBE4910395.1 MBL fold metallo-hydrolase [Cytobacillus luteolus]MBP1942029.1 glyoxylase-like metal-dependent hydrolase (beta-lactamase superfamily II) [Cytobacillus luteolus]
MGQQLDTKEVIKFTVPTPFPVGDVNLYLIKGDVLTLVDAGVKTEDAWNSFQEQLGAIGLKTTDIEQVVLTHHHPDHVGMLDFFPEALPVIGHPFNNPWISKDPEFFERHTAFFTDLFTKSGIDPAFLNLLRKVESPLRFSSHRSLTSTVTEGDRIAGLPEWRVIETPGHAGSHIVLYRERDGLVIGGDAILAHISPNPLLEPPQNNELERTKPQVQYNQTLKKLLDYDISRVHTGHGEDITELHSLIHKRLRRQEERAFSVLEMLREKPMTAFETCQQLFPTVYQKELMLTMSETIGQLDFLEELGEIKVDKTKEYFVYHAKS